MIRTATIFAAATTICSCAASRAPTEFQVREALIDYSRRYKTSSIEIFSIVPSHHSDAAWSGMPGLCVADVLVVHPRRLPSGDLMGAQGISLRKTYGAVGDLSPPDWLDRDDQAIDQQVKACSEITDTRAFYSVTGDDSQMAHHGARLFQILKEGEVCVESVICDAETVQTLNSVKTYPLDEVSRCQFQDGQCLYLIAGEPERHEIKVWYDDSTDLSIKRVEGSVSSVVY